MESRLQTRPPEASTPIVQLLFDRSIRWAVHWNRLLGCLIVSLEIDTLHKLLMHIPGPQLTDTDDPGQHDTERLIAHGIEVALPITKDDLYSGNIAPRNEIAYHGVCYVVSCRLSNFLRLLSEILSQLSHSYWVSVAGTGTE
jgi:hypothetical protein